MQALPLLSIGTHLLYSSSYCKINTVLTVYIAVSLIKHFVEPVLRACVLHMKQLYHCTLYNCALLSKEYDVLEYKFMNISIEAICKCTLPMISWLSECKLTCAGSIVKSYECCQNFAFVNTSISAKSKYIILVSLCSNTLMPSSWTLWLYFLNLVGILYKHISAYTLPVKIHK